MGWLSCVALICCLSCCSCTATPTGAPQQLQKEQRGCGDPANVEVCFERSVPYKVALQTSDTAVLRCVVRNLDKQLVTWMKNDGRDIPLTIGKSVFTPDPRVSLDNSSPEEWNLVIGPAEVKDSGQYLCQVNGRTGLMAQAYDLFVEESQSPSRPMSLGEKSDPKGDRRFLSDVEESRSKGKSPSVSITGEDTVFEDTRYFPLTCTVKFSTRDAKANPRETIEWYHQGMRQAVNVSSMDISMSWADSDRAVSVLTVYRVQMSHTGEWVCLKRPTEQGSMESATHSLTVLAKDAPVASRAADSARAPPAASLGAVARSAAGPGSSADGGSAAATTSLPVALLVAAALAVALGRAASCPLPA